MPSLEEVNRLCSEAFDALGRGDLQASQEMGERLQQLGHSSGYEVLALVAQATGDYEKAARIAEDGLLVAPGVWILWKLVGTSRSQQGDYKGARQAFERALTCEPTRREVIELDLVVIDAREGDFEAGLARIVRLKEVDDDAFTANVFSTSLWLRRLQRAGTAAGGQYLRVMFDVPVDKAMGKNKVGGFMQSVDVVATHAEAALSYLVEDLGQEYADAAVESLEVIQPAPNALLGVYAVNGGRAYYPLE